MYQVAAPIWNAIAKTTPLQTKFAQRLFALDQEALNQALEQEEKVLVQKQGVERKVAVAFLTVAPPLWEARAIASFKALNPQLPDGSLPNLTDRSEALALAAREYRLTHSERIQLANLLKMSVALASTPSDDRGIRRPPKAPALAALARVFERLAVQEPDSELKKQREAEAAKLRKLAQQTGVPGGPNRAQRDRLS